MFKNYPQSFHFVAKCVSAGQVRLVASYRTRAMLGSCGCSTRITCSCNFEADRDRGEYLAFPVNILLRIYLMEP